MKFLITIIGPTASGKTSLAIELAKAYHTEIISADSRQFYKEMSIGTAKPTETELQEAKHHFIDSLSINDPYNVGEFEDDALQKIEEIHQFNENVIMVGGSGLYINAVTFGIDPFPEISAEIRSKVIELFQEEGIEGLKDVLRKLDPEYYVEVDLDNHRRLMRAIEVCYATEQPYSSFRKKTPKKRSFTPIKLAYDWDRDILYNRINQRVDLMLEQGLLEETKQLYRHKELKSLDTIGYKELFAHFDGEFDLEEAIRLIKRNSRRYAKRQLTWFRNDPSIIWLDPKIDIQTIITIVENQKNEISKQ